MLALRMQFTARNEFNTTPSKTLTRDLSPRRLLPAQQRFPPPRSDEKQTPSKSAGPAASFASAMYF
jgi:hypothetical protein